MRAGLIGHTGFVGGVLDASYPFTERYNTKNFREMAGESFDLLVCAGVSAAKWLANRNPEQDLAAIDRLVGVLDRVEARELILISTIDVYPDASVKLDETAVIDPDLNHAYGRHRLRLEERIRARFPSAHIVRLPALFGPGLKKNALYDLLNDNGVEQINPAGAFQWYPVTRLWHDLGIVRARELGLVNLFTEPLTMRRIIDGYFQGATVAEETRPAPTYRLKTCYAAEFGGADGYIMSSNDCYEAIGEFVDRARGATD